MPRFKVQFDFHDSNLNEARVTLHTRDVSYAAAEGFALTAASVFTGVSDARLYGFTLLQEGATFNGDPAEPASDCRAYGLFFYRNGDRVTSISLPSTPRVLTEVTGPYSGTRITRERLDVLGLLNAVEDLPRDAVDPLGRPLGTTFSVGSRHEL